MNNPKNMPNGANQVLMPKLRFPEFRDMAWELMRLDDVAPLQRGFDLTSTQIQVGNVPVVYSNGIQNFHAVGMATAPGLVTGRSGTIGKLHFIEAGEYWPHNTALWVTSFKGNLPKFVYYLFASIGIERFVSGSGVPTLNRNDVHDFSATLPHFLAEQAKIADCLSTLDELVGAESQKLDALKVRKNGLMHQIFPREGETLPGLRFPEFRDAGAWSTKVAGDLFTNRKEDGEQGLPIYSVTMNDGMIPRASFDRDFSDIEDPAGNKKVCKGDIAYNMMRMWQGAQGVAREDCMVSPAYVVLAPRSGVCPNFFAYLFKLPQSLLVLTAISRGLTKDRLRLYFDDFARMRLCIPALAEQQRIASFLASLDELIATQHDKISALKSHKKGLMQQLFPPPTEAEA
jgi:type I restriction enzyme S subunit